MLESWEELVEPSMATQVEEKVVDAELSESELEASSSEDEESIEGSDSPSSVRETRKEFFDNVRDRLLVIWD